MWANWPAKVQQRKVFSRTNRKHRIRKSSPVPAAVDRIHFNGPRKFMCPLLPHKIAIRYGQKFKSEKNGKSWTKWSSFKWRYQSEMTKLIIQILFVVHRNLDSENVNVVDWKIRKSRSTNVWTANTRANETTTNTIILFYFSRLHHIFHNFSRTQIHSQKHTHTQNGIY